MNRNMDSIQINPAIAERPLVGHAGQVLRYIAGGNTVPNSAFYARRIHAGEAVRSDVAETTMIATPPRLDAGE